MKTKNILAFIPARAKSKRLPNKNIKNFAGKPLIAWTIEAALATSLNMDVIVSTECTQIAKIAKKFGAEVPFLRPEIMARDDSSAFDALKDTLVKLAKVGRKYEYIIFLQPTSPLRQSFHIEEAFTKLVATQAKSVVSVSKVEHPAQWSMSLPDDESMSNYINNNLKVLQTRSQQITQQFRLNGAIYCGKTKDVLAQGSFYVSENIYAYKMGRIFSVDIDNIIDFEYAEFLSNKL